jgi:hypothetical protein
MTTPLRTGAVTLAAAVGIALAGCSSGTSGDAVAEQETTSSEATSSSAPSSPGSPTQTSPAAAPQQTIAEYLRENDVEQTPVAPGAPGAPKVDLPQLPGWEDAGPRAPEGAYSAVLFADPSMAQDPPMISTYMSRLTGNVDPAGIFAAAPAELTALPGFEYLGDGRESELSGFDAYQFGGAYTRDGVKRMIAQKTVFIPTQGDAYLLQLTADGTEDQIGPLLDATSAIDEQTVITP